MHLYLKLTHLCNRLGPAEGYNPLQAVKYNIFWNSLGLINSRGSVGRDTFQYIINTNAHLFPGMLEDLQSNDLLMLMGM